MAGLDVDPAAWAILDQLLGEALERPPGEREAWLAGLSPERRPLEPYLRRLLAHAASPVDTPPRIDRPGDDTDAPPAGRPGQELGPYRLVRRLGVGGMAEVWLAERADGLVQRPVALKLPRGAYRRPDLVERMAREREILSGLNHPHVARLYDAGVAVDDQPWLAMELVEGRPVDAWAREERPPLRRRLELFLQVAGAVAHAHAHLVVHRDLKPGNILVTAEGEARLLDFGIAKLLEQGLAAETELTRLGGRVLTPGYASPEQIAGKPVGVATDVYSLGVVLYELLTGARPYRLERSTPSGLEEAILLVEPVRPSEAAGDPAVARALRGDLETVLLKALRKPAEERYATVDAFADDVRAWLDGRPVRAQPDRLSYRLRKLLGRHRLAAGVAAAALLAVLGGAAAALWQARLARAEQARAEQVKELLSGIFTEADPWVGGTGPPSAEALLVGARERLLRRDDLSPALRVELLTTVGGSLNALERYHEADRALAPAVDEGRRSLGEHHPLTLRGRVLLLETHRMLGRTAEQRAGLEALEGEAAAGRLSPAEAMRVLEGRAHLDMDEGRYREAEGAAERALALARQAFGERHEETASAAGLVAAAHRMAGNTAAHLPAARLAVALNLAAHDGNDLHPGVIDARAGLGSALVGAGQLEEGIAELAQATAAASRVFGDSAPMVGYFSGHLAKARLQAGQVREALVDAERHRRILTAILAPGSANWSAAVVNHATALLAARRGAEALAALDTALPKLEASLGPGHASTVAARVKRALALTFAGRAAEGAALAAAQVAAARAAGPGQEALVARALYVEGVALRLGRRPAEALARQREALAAAGDGPRGAVERFTARAEEGLALVALGQTEEGEAALDAALAEMAVRWPGPTPERADALTGLGRARLAQGRADEALAPLEEASRAWRTVAPGTRWEGEAALWLGRSLRTVGQRREASEALDRARRLLRGRRTGARPARPARPDPE
jgi:serine/threonine-protein kinase